MANSTSQTMARQTMAQPAASSFSREAIHIARGALLLLAIAPVTALAPGARAAPLLAAAGDLVVAPGLMFLAGLILAQRLAPATRRDALRALRRAALIALGAALAFAAFGHVSGAGWRGGLGMGGPVLQMLVLAPLYALLLWSLRARSSAFVLALAVFLHVFGVLSGTWLRFALPLFVYYAAGAWFAQRQARFVDAIDQNPSAAALAAPIVVAFALVISLKVPTAGFSVAAVGPGALGAGLGSGVAMLALGAALAGEAGWLSRLGRLIAPIALIWPPLYLALATWAAHGAPPRPLALALLATATLAIVAALADLVSAGVSRRDGPTAAPV